ncbi:unnamed protein product [Soboliphyme baturini]|uniref:Uncharacterized protein n=1 Tax=Soboliphyme baturini TaxID=241478 RepID=A0A183IMU6_9BILA|nr:unnamed protein product [Soboliphyme baturini]
MELKRMHWSKMPMLNASQIVCGSDRIGEVSFYAPTLILSNRRLVHLSRQQLDDDDDEDEERDLFRFSRHVRRSSIGRRAATENVTRRVTRKSSRAKTANCYMHLLR